MKKSLVVLLSAVVCCSVVDAQSWFTTGQHADLMVSGVGFNNTGGPLYFNHPSGIASDGTRFLLCDRFNNRVLIWNSLPTRWDAVPDLVLGQTTLLSNDPGSSKSELNWPGNVSVAANGIVAVADTENDRILLWKAFPIRNATPADIEIFLPTLSPPGGNRYEWPWGVWTDGVRLAAVATRGSVLLFWNTMPITDNQPPDYLISLPEFGTPRNISTDGSTYFFVGDHNAKVSGDRAGTFYWNSYPIQQHQRFNFYRDEWIKGTKLPDGKLIAGGLASVYLWNSVPASASQQPDLVLTNAYYKNGDGPDIVYAGGKLFVNNYNGNNAHVYNSVPTSATQQPDFALGSPSPTINTLDSIGYIQNPVVATDGTRLLVSSDFDRTLWIWRSLPTKSGQKPDVKISLSAFDLAPWDNALHNGRFVAAGKERVAIWESVPLSGQAPSRIFTSRIGSAQFQEVKGVALDDLYLYLADRNGTIFVWSGLPISGNEDPFRVITVPNVPLNHLNSDGVYLTVAVQGNPPVVYIYRVADITSSVTPQPWKVISSSPALRLNLPASALTFNGSLAIANTGNNSVFLWRDINESGDTSKVVVLGQSSAESFKAAIGTNRLFMPASLAFFQNQLWVGEMKFSSRILRFTAGAVTHASSAHRSSVQNFVLEQNYPNPFSAKGARPNATGGWGSASGGNPTTTIAFTLPTQEHVLLNVYDILGREILTLVDTDLPTGKHSVVFDARSLTSGVYIYRIQAGDFVQEKRMQLVK